MTKNIIVMDDPTLINLEQSNLAEVIIPMDYLTNKKYKKMRSARVFNLSSLMSYQGIGYYVSLLALARRHKVYPDPTVIQDLKSQSMQKIFSEDLDELIQGKLKKIKSDEFEFSIYFGQNLTDSYSDLAKKIFSMIKAPMLRVYFVKNGTQWDIQSIKMLSYDQLNAVHKDFLSSAITNFLMKNKRINNYEKNYLYSLAIMYNPEEPAPPSDQKAIEAFVKAGKKIGIYVDTLDKKEFGKILEYDALFIRETTNVNHHTYRIARKAKAEGLVVVDDPESIVKCTNKVFLEELLEINNIPRPKSIIINPKNYEESIAEIQFPCVVKKPDSAFSQGVYKAKSEDEFRSLVQNLFKSSELLLVQEYLPSDFDWRIGILNGEVLYVCKYYMAKGHWQIVNNQDSKEHEGDFEAIEIKNTPKLVLEQALKAAKLIGKGLYGIDLKEIDSKVYLIEINDNPSIDYGIEDKIEGSKLYEKIMQYFLDEMNKQRRLDNEKSKTF